MKIWTPSSNPQWLRDCSNCKSGGGERIATSPRERTIRRTIRWWRPWWLYSSGSGNRFYGGRSGSFERGGSFSCSNNQVVAAAVLEAVEAALDGERKTLIEEP